MTVVSPIQACRSVAIRHQIGWPNGYGEAVAGFTYFGEDNLFYGVYQIRKREKGYIIVKEKFYRPPVMRTDPQGVQRDKMKAAMLAWQALTEEEKKVWRSSASRQSKRGCCVFVSKHILSH